MHDGKKIYLQPMGTIIGAIHDLIEIQKGKVTYADTTKGELHFTIRMYAFKWELRFTVNDIGQNRCQVQLVINGEEHSHEKVIVQEFALLDSILLGLAQVELSEQGEEREKGEGKREKGEGRMKI